MLGQYEGVTQRDEEKGYYIPRTASSSRPRPSRAVALRFNAFTLHTVSLMTQLFQSVLCLGNSLVAVQLQCLVALGHTLLVLRWAEVGVACKRQSPLAPIRLLRANSSSDHGRCRLMPNLQAARFE